MTHHNAFAVTLTTTDEAAYVPFTVGNSYRMMSDAVGGMIECVHIKNGIDMWCNEEGIMLGLPYNPTATAIYWTTFGFMSGTIFGDVIFTSCDGMGETTSLTMEQVNYLKTIAFDVVGIEIDSTLLSLV